MTSFSKAALWEILPPMPEGNGGFVCGSFHGDLILLGGIRWKDDVKHWRNTIWRFDAEKKKWSEVSTLPESLAYAAFGQTEKGIYFAGGSDGQQTHGTLQFLNHQLELKTLGKLSNPLVFSGSTVADGKLFVVGGCRDANDLKTLTNLFYSVDLKTGKTTAMPEFPGGKLFAPTASAIGDRLYTFSGAWFDATNNRDVNVDSAFVYSMAEKQWRSIKPYPFPVNGLAGCPLDERYILLGGGYKEKFTADAFLYDTKTDSYLKTGLLPFRAMANFIKAGDYIYWLGGEDKMKHRSDLVYRILWKELLRDATIEARSIE